MRRRNPHIDSYDADETASLVARYANSARGGRPIMTDRGVLVVRDYQDEDTGDDGLAWAFAVQGHVIAAGALSTHARSCQQRAAFVLPEFQRRGVYGHVIDTLERALDCQMRSDPVRTREAEAFWDARSRSRQTR